MVCDKVLAWILSAARPEQPPQPVLKHLAVCPGCRQQWQRMLRLEAALAIGPDENAGQAGLELFLQRHGFTKGDAEPAARRVPATVPASSPEIRRVNQERLRWLIVACIAMAVIAGAVTMWLGVMPPGREAGQLAQSGTSNPQNDTNPTVSAPPIANEINASRAAGDQQPAGNREQNHSAKSAGVGTASGTSDFATASPSASPLDGRELLARAQAELRLLWHTLDQTLPLLDTTDAGTRWSCMAELAMLLAEETLNQARKESAATCVQLAALFERCVAVLPLLAVQFPPENRRELLRPYHSRLLALAETAREQLARQSPPLAETLRRLAVAAERVANELEKRSNSDSGGPWTPDRSPLAVRSSLFAASITHPESGRPGHPALASDQVETAAEPITAVQIFPLSASASDPFCVLFTANETDPASGAENLTAYLVLLSLRQDFLELVLRCAVGLAEHDDSCQRMEIALDLAEGLVRMLAVVSGAGTSPLAERIGQYLGAVLSGMVRGNWPQCDTASDARSEKRQQAWKETEQRLADLLAVLRTEATELPLAARSPWELALAAAQPGIEALESALEQGPPQPIPQPAEPAKPTAPIRKPADRPTSLQSAGPASQPVPTRPLAPASKPAQTKPEKPKPMKPPFHPGKPFPDRFKDLKEIWHGKKR